MANPYAKNPGQYARRRPSWKQLTETATEIGKYWTNREIVQFHYFNPNGLYARKHRNNTKITQLVDKGMVPSGWHIAYGTFDDYWCNNLVELHGKRKVNSTKLSVCLKLLEENCEKQETKIIEAITGEAS